MTRVTGSNQAVIRAMVTDDTSLYRRTIADILDGMDNVEVIAAAYDGEDCLVQASKLLPDFITMDIQMPRRNGLSTLEEIKKRKLPIHVVMVCSETEESAEQTVQALRMGALDMILKPNGTDFSENKRSLEQQLANHVQTVRALKGRRNPFAPQAEIPSAEPAASAPPAVQQKDSPEPSSTSSLTAAESRIAARRRRAQDESPQTQGETEQPNSNNAQEDIQPAPAAQEPAPVARRKYQVDPSSIERSIEPAISRPKKSAIPQCICIGVSTGGPQSLGILIQDFPLGLPLPIFIVQHMPPIFTKSLADHLNRSGKIRVSEAVDGEMAKDGHIYIAPGGKHMRVDRKPSGLQIQITNDPPVGACKPSVDYLFESVERCVGGDAIAIILTGMGADGLAGCKKLHASGARVIAQNAETCVVYGMPRQIVDNNLAHEILPLSEIASRIGQLVPKRSIVCN
jgi:two-component system chemotaxis response regulator CheB